MQISVLSSELSPQWDQFVRSHSDGTFFHLSAWKNVLESVFKHKTHYLLARDGDELIGILPLVHMKSILFGSTLASTPFCVVGGALASRNDARECLISAACALAKKLSVGSFELRNRVQSDQGWPVKNLYVNFSKSITADHDSNLSEIPRKQRAMVRKGLKQGLVSEEIDDVSRFYEIYSTSVKNLGTPVFTKKLFVSLFQEFGDACKILVIRKDNRDVAAVMSFYYKDQVLPYYGGSLPEARRLYANDFMYWELMRRSADTGINIFDYGRSKVGTGSYSFKKNWGFVPAPLYYEYLLVKDTAIPEHNPTNKKYSAAIDLWKKLPLPVANFIGPFVSKTLG